MSTYSHHGAVLSSHGRIMEEIPEDTTARHGVATESAKTPTSPLGLSRLDDQGDGIELGASQRRNSYRGRKPSSGEKSMGASSSTSKNGRPHSSARQSSLSSLGSRFSQSFRGLKNRQVSSLSDMFFSRTEDSTPTWMLKRRLSTRTVTLPNEDSYDENDPNHDATNHGKDVLDHVENAMTMRELPRGVVDDGFKIPSFAVTQLQNMSDKPVGKGCQAHIWSAIVPEGRYRGQKVALKVLRADYASTEAECESFVREAHLLARMKHVHILTALGVSTTVDKLPCLLLSWCATDVSRAMRLKDVGGRADVRAEVVAAWSSRERLRILRELASALEFLHSGDAIKGGVAICHRDLKPDNFGLTESSFAARARAGSAFAEPPGAGTSSSSWTSGWPWRSRRRRTSRRRTSSRAARARAATWRRRPAATSPTASRSTATRGPSRPGRSGI